MLMTYCCADKWRDDKLYGGSGNGVAVIKLQVLFANLFALFIHWHGYESLVQELLTFA